MKTKTTQTNEQIFKRNLLYLLPCLALIAFQISYFAASWPYVILPTWILMISICVCSLLAFKTQQKEGYLSYTSCIARYREYNKPGNLKLFFLFIFLGLVLRGVYLIIALFAAWGLVSLLNAFFKGTLPQIKDEAWRAQRKKAFASNIFIFCAWIMSTHTQKAMQAFLIAIFPLLLLLLGVDNPFVYVVFYITMAYAGIRFLLSWYLLL